MPNRHKLKGTRAERAIVNMHKKHHIMAYRVPGSGAFENLPNDVVIAKELRSEVKKRKGGSGFLTLERWMGAASLLFLWRDHKKPMVVMEWDTYIDMIDLYAQHHNAVLPSHPSLTRTET